MDTTTRAAKIPSLHHQTEINWDNLDMTKLYVVGAGMFSCVTVALYPVSVIKTRLQVASGDAMRRNALATFRNILKADGVPGLYRGFGTVITGAIPARIIFLTALEKTKATSLKLVEPLKLSEPVQAALANGLGGLTASLCSQAVFVPIDVVSQKLMVQGYSGHVRYNGGLDVAQKIIKADGWRGLYRGFGLSVMTYSPSSAVWWASYGSSQRLIWSTLGRGHDKEDTPSQFKIVGVQATGGIIAGAVTSCVSTPIDTIKTRLQVNQNKPKAREIVRKLIAEDGWKGFYRGLGPRFFSSSAWGTSMIVCYEYLSMAISPFRVYCILYVLLLILQSNAIADIHSGILAYKYITNTTVHEINSTYMKIPLLEIEVYGFIVVTCHHQSIPLVGCTIIPMCNTNHFTAI